MKLSRILKVGGRIVPVIAFVMLALGANAEAKQATLKATGYTGSAITDFQALVKLSASNDAYGFSYADCAANDGSDPHRFRRRAEAC